MKPRLDNRLYYLTVEDESVLGETFPRIGDDTYAITFKVQDTDDVFVTTAETKDAMERHDIPFNVLAEEDGMRVSVHHNELSREELGDYEDALRALALAYQAIGLFCVGVNGDKIDLGEGVDQFCYFTAPAGHTFIWRLFRDRQDAIAWVDERKADEDMAVEWANTLPLGTSEELKDFH